MARVRGVLVELFVWAIGLPVNLALVERVSGPQAVLWNRQARCRRIGCDGVVEFRGKNPKITTYIRLRAGWPEG